MSPQAGRTWLSKGKASRIKDSTAESADPDATGFQDFWIPGWTNVRLSGHACPTGVRGEAARGPEGDAAVSRTQVRSDSPVFA